MFWLILALRFSPSLPGKWQQGSDSFQASLLRLFCWSSGLSHTELSYLKICPSSFLVSMLCMQTRLCYLLEVGLRVMSYLRDINSACEVCTLLKAKGLHCDMKSDRKHQPQVSSAPVSSLTRLHDACHLSCHARRTCCVSLFLVHTIPPHL